MMTMRNERTMLSSLAFPRLTLAVSMVLLVTSTTAVVAAWTSTTTALTSTAACRGRAPRSTALRQSAPSATAEAETTTAAAATTATTSSTEEVWGKTKRHSHCTSPGDRDILVRAARGEITERTPCWFMRQAGRYMAAFREYSDTIPFRERSETPDYAVELSLQCHRAYGMDGIIMFSDILTPLPVLGIDFDVVRGVGPIISTRVRTEDDVRGLMVASSSSSTTTNSKFDFDGKVGFVRETLRRLSVHAEEENTSLIGFVGAPFTLAAYTVEGKSSKHCLETKKLLMAAEEGSNACMTLFLETLAEMIGEYGCYQIESGAQIIQVFESWAHQLSPKLFEKFAKPAAERAMEIIKSRHPEVPVIYFANGGSGYLELQRDMKHADMIALDWGVRMDTARTILGKDKPVSGNLDPTILFGSKEQIQTAVRECIDRAGGPGQRHILNLGHGVMQGTPEIAVQWMVDACKAYNTKK